MKDARDNLYMASNGIVQPIGPETDAEWAIFESFVCEEYNRLHPDDSFEDLKRRARFSRIRGCCGTGWRSPPTALRQRFDEMPQTRNTDGDQGNQTMTDTQEKPDPNKPLIYQTRDIDSDNTLLPMLIAGLVLVVLGAVVVMMFV